MNERLEAVLAAAMQKDSPQERARYLDEACGTDGELRRQLDALLRVQEQVPQMETAQPATAEIIGAAAESVGLRIGPYKLLQKIGEGGMGMVFMADQEEPVRRRVAVKVIKPGMDSKQVIARFAAERQALAMMDHLNIAKVLDAGATDRGLPYFVMELVHGVPITRYCEENHLPVRARLEMFIQVCQAIQHAHQKGVIHRDIKPSNIMVTLYDGKPVPKVIDFGVAKATEQRLTERTLFTQYGTIVGTLEYMAPEQAEMSGLGVDTRSDIYSLGVLLYELLTGTTPLSRQRLRAAALDEVLRMIREEEPPRPSSRLSDTARRAERGAVPGPTHSALRSLRFDELDWIVMKCLEKDRTRRYDSASALGRDIERYLRDEPVEACPPSLGYRLRKSVRKHRRPLAAAAAFALLLLTSVVVSVGLAVRATLAEADAVRKGQELEKERDRAAAKTEEAVHKGLALEKSLAEQRHLLYAARLRQIAAAWENSDIARALDLLERTRPGPGERDLRGFEWHYWQRRCDDSVQTVEIPALKGEAPMSIDEYGEILAVALRGSRSDAAEPTFDVRILDTSTGREILALPRSAGNPLLCELSPFGEYLALLVSRTSAAQKSPGESWIQLWDLKNRKLISTLIEKSALLNYPSFSFDGKRVAATVVKPEAGDLAKSSLLKIWESATGRLLKTIEVAGDHNSPRFSQDGARLAMLVDNMNEAGEYRSAICIWDSVSGAKRQELKLSPGQTGHDLAFSPSGRYLATAEWLESYDPTAIVRIWEVADGKEVQRFAVPGGYQGLCFSPEENHLAVHAANGRPYLSIWDVVTGKEQRRFRGHVGTIEDITFSKDGARLVSVGRDGAVKRWDARPPRNVAPSLERFEFAVMSPDGGHVAARSAVHDSDSVVLLNTAKVHSNRKPLLKIESAGYALAFSPNSKYLAATKAVSDREHRFVLHEVSSGRIALELKSKLQFTDLVFSPDNGRVAGVCWDAADQHEPPVGARILDVSGKVLLTLNWAGKEAQQVAFRPDGAILAVAVHDLPEDAGAKSGHVFLCDAVTGKVSGTLQAPAPLVWLGFSPDGKMLVVCSGKTAEARTHKLNVWDVDSGQSLYSIENLSGLSSTVIFSPDSRRFLTIPDRAGGGDGARLYDSETGQELLFINELPLSAVFSADGNRLTLFNQDGRLQILDGTPRAAGAVGTRR